MNAQSATQVPFINTQDSPKICLEELQAAFCYVKDIAEKIAAATCAFFMAVLNAPFQAIECIKNKILFYATALILPSIRTDVSDYDYSNFVFTDDSCSTSVVNFPVEEGVELSGIQITKNERADIDSPWIVFFMPNGVVWEDYFDVLLQRHLNTGANILCYNYRGAGKNKVFPFDEKNLVEDGKLIVNELLKKANSKKVILHGYSFGGSIATQVARAFAELGITLSVCNERSFTALADVIRGIFPWIIAELACFFANFLNWHLNSELALQKLKDNQVVVISCEKDGLIANDARFIQAVNRQKEAGNIREENVHEINFPLRTGFDHNRGWTNSEQRQYKNIVSAIAGG